MIAETPPAPRTRRRSGGFSLVELLIAGTVVAIIGMAGVAYVARAAQSADFTKDTVFARQKAMSILSELRAYVEGGEGQVAADLDGFDDGISQQAALTIAPDPANPGQFVAPDQELSGNVADLGEWRWYRRITVKKFPGVATRDLRICTVRMFRHRPSQALPGDQMAEVSSVVRTIGDSFPTTQVYDVYLLALENIPGWWVFMDSIKPFIDAMLGDLQARNPGLEYRVHWITESGYGRDELYAPYTNETRVSTDATPWAYFYPGRMPAGNASARYYVPGDIHARINVDGTAGPVFSNDYAASEPYADANGNGVHDAAESFTDVNGDGAWNVNNPVPYAMADQFNHCMRWYDENRRFTQRVAAGLETDDTPTWRLLLDRMIATPDKFHNAILMNLHGELLPMPAVRNYSDAARDPAAYPGWRVVAHPELLRPRRTTGSDLLSDAPRWRVYAYKTEFPGTTPLMTQQEPFTDVNKNGVWDAGEPFQDWNGDGAYTAASVPVTISIPSNNCAGAPNAAASPSLIIKRLKGGIDADGNGVADPYAAFANASVYPEAWNDANGDGVRNRAEPYLDLNGNGAYDAGEPYQNLDGGTVRSAADETFTDANGDGIFERASPADVYTDTNANGKWDAAEPFWDANGDGVRNGPTVPVLPWRAWNPAVDNQNPPSRAAYVAAYGEPYKDVNANGVYDAAEPLLYDFNGNGVWDGGYTRGEMWARVYWDTTSVPGVPQTVVELYGTPLYTPETADGRGLDAGQRLYDLEYIPCPMINTASSSAPPFERDLYNATLDVPKNTARWTIELPLAQVRKGFETGPGLNNGDAADRILTLEARIGFDKTTGRMWPTANHPENVSRAYSYLYNVATTVPFSERYQFQGDPRHCPYADLDRYGASFPNGYNWYFDNFNTSGNAQAKWLAFDTTRMRALWEGRNQIDTPRFTSWLRAAIVKDEAIYTTLTGFSYYYLSVGGDVGYDSANGYASSIPVDGTPYGVAGSRFEDTIANTAPGQRLVRSANGAAASIRSGGYWWSKPWLGELYQDAAFAGQWMPWGNLRAATGSAALTYQNVGRGQITTAQQPVGTALAASIARTQDEGCTSVFNIGASGATFHHQYADGQTGTLTGDGPQLAANYNFPIPTTAGISRPFGLATNGSGGDPDEFTYTTDYPRYTASNVVTFFNHQSGQTGSSLVRLVEPGASPRAGLIVVNGIDRTTESGSAFIARYALITLAHGFLAGGVSGTGRVKQLPRVQIKYPTIVTELTNPVSIPIQWKVEWKRWDGLPYTSSYAASFAEAESDLAYVLSYSPDGGTTWVNMKDGTAVTPGRLPLNAAGVADPAKTVSDAATGDETFTWNTPAASYPEGSYLIRIEAYRKTEVLHYAHHEEKIYVNR